jgi:hypothetical protein
MLNVTNGDVTALNNPSSTSWICRQVLVGLEIAIELDDSLSDCKSTIITHWTNFSAGSGILATPQPTPEQAVSVVCLVRGAIATGRLGAMEGQPDIARVDPHQAEEETARGSVRVS